MHAALAMAEGPAGVGSAGGADKATVAVPEALGPGAYGGAGGGGGGRCEMPPHSEASHGADAPRREGERELVESETRHCEGHQRDGPAERGTCQDTERMRPGDRYSPLETAEEGTRRDMGPRGTHMSWGPQTVRTGKGCDRLKGTHLRRPQREDMAHRKKAASRGALTSWGQQSEGGHAKCPSVGIL